MPQQIEVRAVHEVAAAAAQTNGAAAQLVGLPSTSRRNGVGPEQNFGDLAVRAAFKPAVEAAEHLPSRRRCCAVRAFGVRAGVRPVRASNRRPAASAHNGEAVVRAGFFSPRGPEDQRPGELGLTVRTARCRSAGSASFSEVAYSGVYRTPAPGMTTIWR
jgi:hypothetical protein